MSMTDRELNLAIFRHEPVERVLWQPRIEPWVHWHRIMGSLPTQYEGWDVRDIYRDLGISMRYLHDYKPPASPVVREFDEEVVRRVENYVEEESQTVVLETPHAELVSELHYTVDKTWRTVEFPVRDEGTLRGLIWLLERTNYRFDAQAFEHGSEYMGDLGEPQFYLPKSPYQSLAQEWMTLQGLIYALVDMPELVEEVMAAIDHAYDPLYEQICEYSAQAEGDSGVNIANFGENIHDSLLSPQYFEQYLIPFWQKRCDQLHEAGIASHVHIDGNFKSLLPYLAELPFDGIEALTPEPQGDVSLEEMRDHMGEKILLDGIPAIFFMPTYPLSRVEDCVKKLIDYFHPRLVLGISDEIPEGVDESGLDKIRWVSEYLGRI